METNGMLAKENEENKTSIWLNTFVKDFIANLYAFVRKVKL